MATTTGGRTGLDAFFKISDRRSTVRTEVVAGVATWLTMAYILFVNPSILGNLADRSHTTLAFPQVLTVTALVAGVMTLAMGLWANYPFALAAGLGLNAFVAFTLVLGRGLTWPEAMGVIVIEGLAITVLVLTGFREAVLNAIPLDLKKAIGIGIGLFIALIGFVNAGIVCGQVKSASCAEAAPTVVALNPNLRHWGIFVFVLGLVITAALVARRVRGALLISIVTSTIVATIINEAKHLKIWQDGIAALPHKIFASPDFGLVGNFSFNVFHVLGVASAIAVILAVMLSDFFDTMGTVVGIGGEAGLLDENGRLPGIQRVLLVDSLAAAAGGAASASSNTTFIESAAGVAEGGRTGLTAVVTGVLFLAALFISPIAGVIPPEATAPVLVIVGYFMTTLVKDIDWADPGIGIPALLTISLMPFTFSITNGVGAGFVSYVVIAILRGRWRDVHPLLVIVAGVFVWYFVHGVI
ncbi:MAG: NCS2 family permease [Actinomycetota bacterium]|nr:NCS2 family permease [Actinomycetota bacterium]